MLSFYLRCYVFYSYLLSSVKSMIKINNIAYQIHDIFKSFLTLLES